MKSNNLRLARTPLGIIVLMVIFSLMSYFDRIIMSIAGPGIIKEFGISETELGSVYTAFLIGYALMMIPGGKFVDRYGPRVALTVTGLGTALFTGLTALGGNLESATYGGVLTSFLVIRFVLGVTTAPIYPSCARANANWVPPAGRARVQGFIAAGAGIGGAISPVLFTWTIDQYGWRVSFWLAGLVTAVLALIWAWYARDHPEGAPASALDRLFLQRTMNAQRPTPWRQLLTNRNLLLLTIAYFTVCYFEYVFFFWIYYYLGEIRGLDPQQTAVATTIVFLTWTVMSPLGGWLSDDMAKRFGSKVGRRVIPIVAATLSAVALCVGINLNGTAATVIALSLSFGLAASTDGPYWASAIHLGGEHVGAACGILNTGGNLGGLGPLVAPLIAAYSGWTESLYSGSVVLMVSVLLWFFIDPTQTIGKEQMERGILE